MRILIILILLPFLSMAQNNSEVQWGWSHTYGNQYYSVANKVIVDDNLDIFVCGMYEGTLTIGSETIVGLGYPVPFLAKFDELGNPIWLKSLDAFLSVQTMLLDENNDIRILFDSNKIAVFSSVTGGVIESISLPPMASGVESAVDFELDDLQNMYVVSTQELPAATGLWCKIAKYNSVFDTLWTRSFQIGSMSMGANASNIAIDSNDNVYISGTADFGYEPFLSGTTIQTNLSPVSPGTNIYLAKYNSQGDAIWLNVEPVYFVELTAMEVNTVDNSMYLTGYQITDEVINNDTLYMDTTNQQQIYLIKYDLSGGYNWSKAFPLATKSIKTFPNASWGALGSHLSVSDSGNVYLKGSFTGTIIFQNDTLIEDTTSVVLGSIADDVFIAKLDSNGNPIWGKYAGNSGGYGEETGGFWVDAVNDIIYMVGYYVLPNNLKMTIVNSTKNIFIGKEGDPFAGIIEITNNENTLLVYPNPSEGIYYVRKSGQMVNCSYHIMDLRGNVLMSAEFTADEEVLDLSQFSVGMYILQTDFGVTKLLKE